MKKIVVFGATVILIAVIVAMMMARDARQPSQNEFAAEGGRGVHSAAADRSAMGCDAPQVQDDVTPPEDDSEDPDEPQTEEEKREAEEEKLVEAFDDLTDKWMEPSPRGVSMNDVDSFTKSFRKVPKARQDECIHRALNLIPDENVMLLAGVLMDKSMDKEIVEAVYDDILNRDEDVKKPILQQIFKDKTHSCWANTAWILDVTGELPEAK